MRIMVRKAGTASLTLPHLILTTLIIISEPTRIKAAAQEHDHLMVGGYWGMHQDEAQGVA